MYVTTDVTSKTFINSFYNNFITTDTKYTSVNINTLLQQKHKCLAFAETCRCRSCYSYLINIRQDLYISQRVFQCFLLTIDILNVMFSDLTL